MMERSAEQLKHIQRISRQTRHHRIQLNQVYDQRLQRDLTCLDHDYQQNCYRIDTQKQLEQQRERLLNVTIKQIAREKRRPTLSTMNTTTAHCTIEPFPKCPESRPSTPPLRLPPAGKSCHLFSRHCELYPCQPVYQYTSFIKQENDQTLQKRNPSADRGPSTKTTDSSELEQLFKSIEEKKHHQNRRELAVTVHNQHHLTNRHVFMQRTMAKLDEQSRVLHQRLTDRKSFGYVKERQHDLRQALQRHLEISAKFCAAT